MRYSQFRMHRAQSIALFGLGLLAAESAAAQAPSPSRVDTFRVTMPQLGGRGRTVRVYLPPGYAAGDRRYPVLYMQDAQNLFAPGPYGDWEMDETLDRMAVGGHGGMIVVGVDHGERRWDEYGPWTNRQMRDWVDPSWAREAEGGEGAAYVDFLAATLKPEIDRRYRTLVDAEHTGIGGSSMGGLISLYAAYERSNVFGRVMAMSPAVWFAEDGGPWLSNNRLVDYLRARTPPPEAKFYLDVGTEERSRDTDPDVFDRRGARVTYPRAYLDGAEAVREALREAGVPFDHLSFVAETGAAHHESAWARRLERALLWLFPR